MTLFTYPLGSSFLSLDSIGRSHHCQRRDNLTCSSCQYVLTRRLESLCPLPSGAVEEFQNWGHLGALVHAFCFISYSWRSLKIWGVLLPLSPFSHWAVRFFTLIIETTLFTSSAVSAELGRAWSLGRQAAWGHSSASTSWLSELSLLLNLCACLGFFIWKTGTITVYTLWACLIYVPAHYMLPTVTVSIAINNLWVFLVCFVHFLRKGSLSGLSCLSLLPGNQ